MGAAFNRPIVARGAAYADFDRDGDLDILISTNHGPAYLYRNDGGNRNHWLNVRLAGTKSNRDGIGAVVRVQTGAGEAMEHGAQRLQLLFGKRPGADLRPGESRDGIARSGVAQRHPPAIRQRPRRPVPDHRRSPRHRKALMRQPAPCQPPNSPLQSRRHRQRDILPPGRRDHLHANRQSARRRPAAHHRGRPSRHVVRHRVAEAAKIFFLASMRHEAARRECRPDRPARRSGEETRPSPRGTHPTPPSSRRSPRRWCDTVPTYPASR